MIRRALLLCFSSLFFAFALSGDTFSFGFATSSALGGDNDCSNTGGCAAGVTITTGNGTLVVQLESFALNPVAPGQLVSGIFVTLGTAPTSDSLTSQSGQLINIASGVASDVSGNPTHWGTSKTGATICLETAGTCAVGGAPINMIIGNSSYSNSNGGLNNGNFDPYIQGIGTFDLNVGGITANTTVTSVTFEFGTGPDGASGGINATCTAGTIDCGPVPLGGPLVPEPMSFVLLGSISLGLASVFRKKLRGTA